MPFFVAARSIAACLIVPALALASCAPDAPPPPPPDSAVAAGIAHGDTITVVGTLIDARCHAEAGSTDCSGVYARQGFPVAVLEHEAPRRDVAWMLVTVPQALADYVDGTVRVTGEVRSFGVLIPHRVELRNGEAWTYIM